jgi:hypothetical protein
MLNVIQARDREHFLIVQIEREVVGRSMCVESSLDAVDHEYARCVQSNIRNDEEQGNGGSCPRMSEVGRLKGNENAPVNVIVMLALEEFAMWYVPSCT